MTHDINHNNNNNNSDSNNPQHDGISASNHNITSVLLGDREHLSAARLWWYDNPNYLIFNFCCIAFCMSINHGTVTALIALASSELGDALAGVSLGLLFLLYTLSALTTSSWIVLKLGPKWALVLSLALYCAYVASFLLAAEIPTTKWGSATIGSVLGGIASGWLWTSQGALFARSAQRYAQCKRKKDGRGVSGEEATALFSGMFATIYVGLEVVFKFLSSVFLNAWGRTATFLIFTVVAAASAGLTILTREPPVVISIDESNNNNNNNNNNNSSSSNIQGLVSDNCNEEDGIEEQEEEDEDDARKKRRNDDNTNNNNNNNNKDLSVSDQLLLAVRLLFTDRRMQLLAASNMTFGVTIALMNLWVTGTPVNKALGADNVGYVAAVDPGVATLLSMPLSWLSEKIGKSAVMLMGAVSSVIVALVVIIVPLDALVSLKWGLVFLFFLSGIGRAVFEATNKATFADFFQGQHEAAFSNVIILSGGAAGIAFFVFPHMKAVEMAVVVLVTSVAAVITIPLAFYLHNKRYHLAK